MIMAITIDKETCIGCESCVGSCPAGALSMKEGKAVVAEESCIACGACVTACPAGAISQAAVEREVANNEGTDLWVMTERDESGELLGVSYELVGAAADLAAKAGEKCCAVLFAAQAGSLPEQLIAAGADKVYVVSGPDYAEYDNELYTQAFCELAKQYRPNAVLFGATVDGRDLAPRIAARLNTGLCADCTALDITADKIVEWTRPALGGNILATILCAEHRPQMGTVRPKIFKAKAADASRQGEIINYTVQQPVGKRVKLLEKKTLTSAGSIKIEDALVLCSGGRGMGSADKFSLLEELAGLFENGAVSGSRAVVDEKWIPHVRQVGQSGKTVTPKVYFACGISGAIQHLAGMKESDIIIAINKDAQAPIFSVANYGIVGDVNVILPKLIAKIKAFKEA